MKANNSARCYFWEIRFLLQNIKTGWSIEKNTYTINYVHKMYWNLINKTKSKNFNRRIIDIKITFFDLTFKSPVINIFNVLLPIFLRHSMIIGGVWGKGKSFGLLIDVSLLPLWTLNIHLSPCSNFSIVHFKHVNAVKMVFHERSF